MLIILNINKMLTALTFGLCWPSLCRRSRGEARDLIGGGGGYSYIYGLALW